MFFTKFPHSANFSFARKFDAKTAIACAGERSFSVQVSSFRGGIYRLQIIDPAVPDNGCLTQLIPPEPCDCHPLKLDTSFALTVIDGEGNTILRSSTDGFGVSGEAWMFQFNVDPNSRFYGMGEKNFGRLELSGIRTKFWNTDVWGDFHFAQWLDHPSDPPYLSIPYVIVKQGNAYVGLLVHSAYPVFMETPGFDEERAFAEWQKTSPRLIIGAEGGRPDLWIIVGPSLKELTRKLQELVGVTPLPPAWALGYHQSRWGYAGHKDLVLLDKQFEKQEIPCDALWLDIDYMDGFRVFTIDKKHFPAGFHGAAKDLKKNGRKLVAILDPGIKKEPGYCIYDDGLEQGMYCLNPEGFPFVGMVWPGETVFPDLTMAKAREWWAGHVKTLAEKGLDAAWVDMNDPSTGPVDPTDMRFGQGKEPHEKHRNQYSLGMQMATYDGFLAARPNVRPFILSRSGFIGTSNYSAVWTGDNLSNYFYLQMAIPASLNLSLSGVPFNGPDIGGFGGVASKQLMADWIKTCFLFPFARNHSSNEAGRQEPWAFGEATMRVVRRYIRLRYKLLPYLYNLFCDQEEFGDPILRPLAYEFESTKRSPLDFISDQFLVGPSILQAPILHEEDRSRKVLLPGREPWLNANNGEWIRAQTVIEAPTLQETPLYFRNGAIVPMSIGVPTDNRKDFNKVEFLIAANPSSSGKSSYRYNADDGISFDYRRGKRSILEVQVEWKRKAIHVKAVAVQSRAGEISAEFLLPFGFNVVTLNGVETKPKPDRVELTGKKWKCLRIRA